MLRHRYSQGKKGVGTAVFGCARSVNRLREGLSGKTACSRDSEEHLKLTCAEKIFVKRLGEMPRDRVSSEYEQATHVVKVNGVWKQVSF